MCMHWGNLNTSLINNVGTTIIIPCTVYKVRLNVREWSEFFMSEVLQKLYNIAINLIGLIDNTMLFTVFSIHCRFFSVFIFICFHCVLYSLSFFLFSLSFSLSFFLFSLSFYLYSLSFLPIFTVVLICFHCRVFSIVTVVFSLYLLYFSSVFTAVFSVFTFKFSDFLRIYYRFVCFHCRLVW